MKKTLIVTLAIAMLLAVFCGQALAAKGDITVVDVRAYSNSAMTDYVGMIPASTAVVVRSHDTYADIIMDGKVVYIDPNALLNKSLDSEYLADLKKGTRVYQRASSTAGSIKLKKGMTVNVCYVLGDWALVRTRNSAAYYGFVPVDKLTDIRLK